MIRRHGGRSSTRKTWRLALWLIIVAALTTWLYMAASATHRLSATATTLDQPAVSAMKFTQPSRGAAAIGSLDDGMIAQYGARDPLPPASMAKTITVLVVLDKYPLAADEDGPTLTMNSADVERYNKTVAVGGSNLPVYAGQQLTLRSVLNAIMLESANNLADSLAIWAFGSMVNYHTAATTWLASHNLTETTIGPDASGLDPATTSSTGDLIKIAQLVLKNAALSQIVAQAKATFAGSRTMTNTNALLSDGFRGIKTGHTSEAGYCLMFAFDYTKGSQTKTIIGVVLGQTSSVARFAAAKALAESATSNLDYTKVVAKGDAVAYYNVPWVGKVEVETANDINALRWKDESIAPNLHLDQITAPKQAGDKVGTLTIDDQSVDLVLASDITEPHFIWRLGHPFATK